MYERIGQVFSSLEKKEPWLAGTRKVAEIGVIADAPVLGAGIKERLKGNPSAEGAWRMLTETHRLMDFLDFTDDLSCYALVILADSVRLTAAEAARIDAYVAAGGKILVTGTAGMDRAGERFLVESPGVRFVGPAAFAPRYARIGAAAFPGIAPMDYVLYAQGTAVETVGGAEVLARIVNPYFNRTWEHFSSHRHTPPAAVSDEPFVVRTGRTAYAAHPLFTDYVMSGCRVYRDIVTHLVDALAGAPLVATDLPTTAEITLRSRDDDLILHVLHYIIQRKCRALETVEEAIPLFDRSFRVRTPVSPRRVVMVPQGDELPFRWMDGLCSFALPKLDGHQVILMEGAQGGQASRAS